AVHNNYGNVLKELNRFEEAAESFKKALRLNPGYAEAHSNRGIVLQALGRFDEALSSHDRALKINPTLAGVHSNRGDALVKLGRHDEALASYARALVINPDLAEVYNNRGNALAAIERIDEALDSYARALKINANYAEAHYNIGNGLKRLRRFGEAVESYARALKINPNLVEAWNNSGDCLCELERFGEALQHFEAALSKHPDFCEALTNRGNVLANTGRFDEALDSYARALAIKPEYADAYSDRGNTLQKLRRFDEALESYAHALAIRPNFAEALNNRGSAFRELKRHAEALEHYAHALAIKPAFCEAHVNRGIALHELKRHQEAVESYASALKINSDYDWLYGTWLHTKMQLCDWRNFGVDLQGLIDKINQLKRPSAPFPVLSLMDAPAFQRRVAESWAEHQYRQAQRLLPPIEGRRQNERLRIGYFSGDFREHPISLLLAEMLETHDRSRFDVVAFSFGPNTQDRMRKRIERAVERFVDVREESDLEIVRLARSMEIDIAVDLGGFTEGGRPEVFAMRSAPLQASYLGYLGTSGARYMDYLIADPTMVPLEHQQHYTEKIVYLPSYQANDSKRIIADRRFTREELGLPPSGFVFCCFNAAYKITPATFDGWMRILRRVEGSTLLLLAEGDVVERNLREEAAARGVDAGRLVFGKRLAVAEYLARYRTADLFLDTSPYNAGTTASDALWAGLPVLTRIGESFAARVAASLLNAIGLPELIATTQEQYESTAVEIATNPARAIALREKLHRNRLTTPLFDTRLFTSNLERAYLQMHARHQAQLSPEHIRLGE
ncbi:MAG: tetratricopeptide repeat protein, partial [Roseiarcus sp.]